ncbi:MAG: glucose-phosphate thymidylyltransferase [Archaeoglobi archaeon]|nr:glucose-phosphate thymidylyltransferase [Archaeoglobi archaeon]
MKVVILAGGYATRLWPVTKSKAKPLLPLGRRKIIDFVYEKVREFGDVIISTNMAFEKEFRRWARDKEAEVVTENTRSEEEKLGAVGALSYVTRNIEDDVLVVAGDNLFDFSLDAVIEKFRTAGEPVVALYDVGDTELAKRYGVAEVRNGLIVNFEEKPEKPKSTLIGVAIYALPQQSINDLHEYVERSGKKDNLGDFLSYLCKIRRVHSVILHGNWHDVGTPDSYLEALRIHMGHDISENVEISKASKIIPPVVIEEDVRIEGRCIIGPYAYIGAHSEVESSDISESVIFERNVLKKVKLWRSIIDDRCEIRNIELSNSIIGGHAKIQRGD